MEKIEYGFLYHNQDLTEISLPSVLEIGRACLYWNQALTELSLPKVKKIGYGFLEFNNSLTKVNIPDDISTPKSFRSKYDNLLKKDKIKQKNLRF